MTKDNNLPKFTIKQMLESGAHFGHKTLRRNPKMSKYIFGSRNGLSIINLEKSAYLLKDALKVVKAVAKNNGRILFVATKKQAFETVAEAAKRCGQYYVNHRWLGGMLTNWKTISQSIKTLKDIEKQLADNQLSLNKKERLVLDRKRIKLDMALSGIRDMGGSPDLVFIIDTNRESLAVAEAKKLGVPIMAILDTNCSTTGITYPIPGNDDSVKAIRLFCRLISDAALSGTQEVMSSAGVIEKKNLDKKDSAIKTAKVSPEKPDLKPKEVKESSEITKDIKKTSKSKEGKKALEAAKDIKKTPKTKKVTKKASPKEKS